MGALPERLVAVRTRIDELSLRERIILFLTAALVLYLLVNSLLLAPLEVEQQHLLERTRAVQAEGVALDQQAVALVEQSRVDPDAEQRQQLEGLQQRQRQLRQRLEGALKDQIAPRQMSQALQELLHEQTGLRLLHVENLPAQAIQQQAEEGAEMIYRHGLLMELEGDFHSTLNYLQKLEDSGWQLRWDEVSLDTTTAPRARIRLRLHTLSMDRGWLGV